MRPRHAYILAVVPVRRGLISAGVLAAVLVAAIPPGAPGSSGGPVDETDVTIFESTGSEQTYTVPKGIRTLSQMNAVGGGGGNNGFAVGGGPHRAELDGPAVTPGMTLYVNVGANGENGGGFLPDSGEGGFNGGGDGAGMGAGGGGATDVRTISRTESGTLASRIVIGAGGGGAGSNGGATACPPGPTVPGGVGGSGGAAVTAGSSGAGSPETTPGGGGGPGTSSLGGTAGAGGTESGGNDASPGDAGSLGQGGDGGASPLNHPAGDGGGGGGGLYGGAGGGGGTSESSLACPQNAGGGGGGGGSSLGDRVLDASSESYPRVVISWFAPQTRIHGPTRVETRRRWARVSLNLGSSAFSQATFECSFEDRAFAPCVDSFERRLRAGRRYKLEARATHTISGNTDPTPAVHRVRVVRVA